MTSMSSKHGIYQNCVLFLTLIPVSVFGSTLNDVWMKSIAKELSEDLGVLKDEELGINYIKTLYSSFEYESTPVDPKQIVNQISQRFEDRINDIFSALMRAKGAIENMQTLDNNTKTTSTLLPCIEDSTKKNSKVCDSLLSSTEPSEEHLKLDFILNRLKSKMKLMKNNIKQQYFISSDLELPYSPFLGCSKIDHRLLWNNYISRNNYVAKNIVLLLDHGGSLSKHHFSIVTSIAKGVIDTLTENDNIALLAISNDWTSPELNQKCLTPNQVPPVVHDLPKFTSASSSRKKIMHKFIDALYKGNGATNHTLGLQKALQVVENSQLENETVMILYVSRGLLSSITEVKFVLEAIQSAAQNISCPLVINTCAVIDDNRPTIYETQFLEDIAYQNSTKYSVRSSGNIMNGTMIAVNSSKSIGFALSRFYAYFNTNNSFDIEKKISLPTWDEQSGDLTLSFTIGCSADNQFGLLGVDVYFTGWADDLVYFSSKQSEYYAFLLDLEGRVIIHPKFASLTMVKQQLQFADISYFEKVPLFHIVRNKVLLEREGFQATQQFGLPVKWSWKRIGDWFIACVVTRQGTPTAKPHSVQWPVNSSQTHTLKIVYQHFQHSKQTELCRYLNQKATLDAGSLYLSSSCFESPSTLQDLNTTLPFLTYLQDNTNLLANPGLKKEIKDEVAALAYILNFLKTQHLSSYKSKYIVRRYVTSYSGVLQMFPGSILNEDLNLATRPWFRQASEHKMKLIMIPPYLDEGGAGYIVTVAYATPHVIVAVDVTYGYIFRLLLKRIPFCLSTNITCFLMDDRGYLIYHRNLIEPNVHEPVEKQHIVHKESLVANDILSHSNFIKKMLCNSYGGGTIQRYYKLNTSYNEVLVSSVQGEQCVSYHISALRNTNVFVGIVNATCNLVVTFCPCSIVDRLCLNCHRMEQKECECPCECPLQDDCKEFDSTNQICNWFPEHVSAQTQFREDGSIKNLKTCLPTNCAQEETHLHCLGITGCEWCQFDVDGTPLDNPFCASMSTCFNGIVGAITPYRDTPELEPQDESYSVPISVIILFIFGILLFLCMCFIYHRSTTPQNERLYMSSTQDNHLRMSDLNLSDNFHTLGNHRDKLLQDNKPDPVSPYSISNNYKRTALTAESDHGYSTMTQHDESEHMSLAPVELESLEDDLASDCVSIRTSALKPPGTEFTSIPRNKCIVVPVTVHRNMETT